MQTELDSIGVVPNVEERLDRLFNRIGILYGGDFESFFQQLKSEETDSPAEQDSAPQTDIAALCPGETDF